LEDFRESRRDLPRSRTCCMCGAAMVEVRASHLHGHVWQEWQCPRCLHTERDRYEEGRDDGADERAD
jgi:rubredoxin